MAKVRTPGFVRLTEAIKRIGPYVCPDWDGTERTAPARSELFRDLGAVLDLPHKHLLREDARYRKSIVEEAERQRAGGAHQSGTSEAIAKLRELIAKPETPESQRAAMRKTLARLIEMQRAPPQPDKNTRRIAARRAERTRHRMADELFAAHEPAEAARARWARAHAILREKVVAGELRAFARPPDGEMLCPAASEWRICFPGSRTSRAYLPSLGGQIPATAVFDATDLNRIFQARSSQQEQHSHPSGAVAEATEPEQASAPPRATRLGYVPELEEFIKHNSKQFADLTDSTVAKRFRECSKRTDLPKKDRDLAKQVAALRQADSEDEMTKGDKP